VKKGYRGEENSGKGGFPKERKQENGGVLVEIAEQEGIPNHRYTRGGKEMGVDHLPRSGASAVKKLTHRRQGGE